MALLLADILTNSASKALKEVHRVSNSQFCRELLHIAWLRLCFSFLTRWPKHQERVSINTATESTWFSRILTNDFSHNFYILLQILNILQHKWCCTPRFIKFLMTSIELCASLNPLHCLTKTTHSRSSQHDFFSLWKLCFLIICFKRVPVFLEVFHKK